MIQGHPDRMMFALLAALALLVPVASAGSVHADVQTDRLQGQGIVQGDGALTALLHPTPSSNRASLPGFEVTAEHLRIETDYADVAVVVEEASFGTKLMPGTRVDHHRDASLSSGDIQTGYRFDVVPMAGRHAQVALDASCAAAEPPGQDQFTHEAFVQIEGDRPDTVIDASNAVQWTTTCAPESTATIAGDFWFSAWAIDLTVQDINGTHPYWSGHQDDQAVTQAQELYVYVTNGTLRIPLGAGGGYALLVGAGGTLNVEGSLQLSNAYGTLTTPAGGVDLGGEPVTLDGALQVQSQRNQDALGIRLQGDADGAVVRGTTLAFPESTGPAWTWIAWTAGILVLAGAVAAWYGSAEWQFRRLVRDGAVWNEHRGRRRRGVVYGYRAERSATHGHPRRTKWWSTLALRRPKDRIPLLLLRARANEKLGDPRAALRDRQALDKLLPSARERARNACRAGRLASMIPDPEAARSWMDRAFAYNDTAFLVESIDAAYDGLRHHSWFKHLASRAESRFQAFQ